ncbi:MAG: tetratricopeptide repeat protein [Sedimentisphaerales bacterium]
MDSGHREKRVKLLICIGLVAATFATYEPTLHNGFVNYDDDRYITQNPRITKGITQDSVVWAFTQPHYYMWHPLTTLSHILDCQLFGLNASWHHLVSLLIHIVNALLVFWVLTNLTGSIWPGAFIAAVFALHPMQVESVAWAAERKTVLSGLFWFLTISVYIWYTKRPGTARYILLFLVFGLCIMTKPVVVTLPLALLLLDYWPLERVKWELSIKPLTPNAQAKRKISAALLIIEKIPLLILSAVLAMVTFISQQTGDVVSSLEILPLNLRIANVFISYIKYIGKIIWPSGLAVIYPYFNLNLTDATVIICTLLFVLATIFCIYIGRRRKYVLVGWLWYVGTLVPMIGLVQVGAQSMANRYMYISILGLLVIAVFAVKEFVADNVRRKILVAVSAAGLLFTLGILTHMQVKHWQNDFTLFGYAIEVTENNVVAESGFGSALFRAGRYNEAVPHLTKALRISPAYSNARNDLGMVFLKLGKLNEAKACFDELIKQKQSSPKVYVNLAVTYAQQGKYDLAMQNCAKAEQLKPDDAESLNNMAWLFVTIGDTFAQDANKAIGYARGACELTAYNNADHLDTLAAAYAAAGKFNDAIATAEKALNVAKAAGRENTFREIQGRLELYKAGKPYREK